MEKIVAARLTSAAHELQSIPPQHMGSLPHCSAVDALMTLLTPAQTALSMPINKANRARKPRPSLLTNDVNGAFNCMVHSRLIEILDLQGYPTYLINWVRSFCAERTMSFFFDGASSPPVPYKAGVPQGSPLSPLLYVIYSSTVLPPNPSSNEPNVVYVDDEGLLQLSLSQKFAFKNE